MSFLIACYLFIGEIKTVLFKVHLIFLKKSLASLAIEAKGISQRILANEKNIGELKNKKDIIWEHSSSSSIYFIIFLVIYLF